MPWPTMDGLVAKNWRVDTNSSNCNPEDADRSFGCCTMVATPIDEGNEDVRFVKTAAIDVAAVRIGQRTPRSG